MMGEILKRKAIEAKKREEEAKKREEEEQRKLEAVMKAQQGDDSFDSKQMLLEDNGNIGDYKNEVAIYQLIN